MSRPAFRLTDDQARELAKRVDEIKSRLPLDTGNHRPFVSAFVAAVYEATGKTYSAAVYRRLLDAYASDRRPSTATLEAEKKAFLADLAESSGGGTPQTPGAGDIAALIRRAVGTEIHAALASGTVAQENHEGALLQLQAQRDWLQQELTKVQLQLRATQRDYAEVLSEQRAAEAKRDSLADEVQALREQLKSRDEALAKMSEELAANRRFSLTAIDQVRGETRAWQDRSAKFEEQVKQLKQESEYLRQAAYGRGAAIPAHLRGEKE